MPGSRWRAATQISRTSRLPPAAGFPNSYDRVHGRTGAHLMVHGACSSSGCYSMTDPQMQEIYAFARDAFGGGQAPAAVNLASPSGKLLKT